jgi:aminopeptidase N
VIHEIAHQWFGNAVTESTWDDAWLSEGFATYFTLLFQEDEYGHEEYIDGLKKARNTVLDFYKKDTAYSIIADRTAETGPVTNIITYQKGAWVLHMLRERIGHENFKKGIRAYYQKYVNANATTDDFIKEMENVAQQDLKIFFYQWLNKPGILKISGGWEYDAKSKEIIIKLNQVQSAGFIYETPIEFQVYETGNKAPLNFTFNLNTKKGEYKIPISSKPALVLADPRTVLLTDMDFKENKK